MRVRGKKTSFAKQAAMSWCREMDGGFKLERGGSDIDELFSACTEMTEEQRREAQRRYTRCVMCRRDERGCPSGV